MPESACLSDAFIEHGTRCSWVFTPEGEFLRVFGDPRPIFGKAASELTGRSIAQALETELAAEWKDRLRRALDGETLVLRVRRDATDWALLVFPIYFQERLYGGGSALEITAWNAAERELRYTVLGALKAQ